MPRCYPDATTVRAPATFRNPNAMHPMLSSVLASAALALAPMAQSPAPAPAPQAPAVPQAPAAVALASPKPAAALEPLAFMAGAWGMSQPNGAMIEEHWMAPRGSAMLGSFRRVLGNGAVPFYEFTQIVAEKDRVVLRQIHVHGNFDPDPKRTEPMVLVLEKAGDGRATFVPDPDPAKARSGDLARITYAADGADTLVLTVEPRQPEGKPAQAPLVFRMKRIS